ncbi:hypothetical protein FHY12_003500 [Xanthomonas arboricola]|nr:hypothetical protein [Xanthomonas euroxanthea]
MARGTAGHVVRRSSERVRSMAARVRHVGSVMPRNCNDGATARNELRFNRVHARRPRCVPALNPMPCCAR